MTLLITYLLIALVISFFCSIAEAALLSVRPAYISTLEQRHARGARALRTLKDNLDRPLAAILTLNTIAHTVGAAGVGAQSAVVFGSAYLGVTSAVLTFLILVLSEIIPKSLGAAYAHRLAPALAPGIAGMIRILLPFVWLSEKLTRLISPRDGSALTFSRDELEAMASIGAKEGQIELKELKIVRNLLRLQVLSVRDIMTPRPVIFAAPAEMTVREFFVEHAKTPFSRIPIYGETRDDITGYVLKTDLLIAYSNDRREDRLETFRRAFLVIPDLLSVSQVFDRLVRERTHIALIVDEYGTTQGLVTQEDVLETLIGLEITDELDTVEDMQALAHKQREERMAAATINADVPHRAD